MKQSSLNTITTIAAHLKDVNTGQSIENAAKLDTIVATDKGDDFSKDTISLYEKEKQIRDVSAFRDELLSVYKYIERELEHITSCIDDSTLPQFNGTLEHRLIHSALSYTRLSGIMEGIHRSKK